MKIDRLLAQIKGWAEAQRDITGVLLVGYHARGTARADSDVDLVILTIQPEAYLESISFAERFGSISASQKEDWGRVTSVRVWYEGGPEVEFGFTRPDWAAPPLDAGTRRVLSDGARVLFDREGWLGRLPGLIETEKKE